MRLVRCDTLEVEEFFSRPVPRYYILSHRWTDDEVSYQDFKKGRRKDSRGYQKILECCRFIWNYHRSPSTTYPGHCYVWIDTCCIDKKSSAELSEAINSMYRYYTNSYRCFAFLPDIETRPAREDTDGLLHSSEWFKRGWTLQELLAPEDVVFLSGDWQVIGHKCNAKEFCKRERHDKKRDEPDIDDHWGPVLNHQLAQITGIDTLCLSRPEAIQDTTVSSRISWAAKRKTTRAEDMAYCLLGLLGVNMPLLYGEGDAAFLRLQEEFIKRSTDQSIFAWKPTATEETRLGAGPKVSGMFARSPANFGSSGMIWSAADDKSRTWPYTTNNRGLDFRALARRVSVGDTAASWQLPFNEIRLVQLNCVVVSSRWGAEIDNLSDQDEANFTPVEIALAEVGAISMLKGVSRPAALDPPRLYERVHNIADLLTDSTALGELEYVQVYVKAFDPVRAMPRSVKDWRIKYSPLVLHDLRGDEEQVAKWFRSNDTEID